MSTLIVIVYPTEHQAEQVRLDFIKMQKEYLVSLEDAVIAVKKPDFNWLAVYDADFWAGCRRRDRRRCRSIE